MKIDDVKVLEALFEAARRHGVRRLEVDDVAVEFRSDMPAQGNLSAALSDAAKEAGIHGIDDMSVPLYTKEPLVSMAKPGTGDLCHCGHSKAIEHNHLGCLIGCDETQCRGEEGEAKES